MHWAWTKGCISACFLSDALEEDEIVGRVEQIGETQWLYSTLFDQKTAMKRPSVFALVSLQQRLSQYDMSGALEQVYNYVENV